MKCEYTVILFRVLAVYRWRTSQLTEEQEGRSSVTGRLADLLLRRDRRTTRSEGSAAAPAATNQPAQPRSSCLRALLACAKPAAFAGHDISDSLPPIPDGSVESDLPD